MRRSQLYALLIARITNEKFIYYGKTRILQRNKRILTELTMSTLTYDTPVSTGYFTNIAKAAWQLVAAVFAIEPTVSQRSNDESLVWLNRLANDCELHSPGLSAELRFMASRG